MCESCICQASGFIPSIQIGEQSYDGPDDPSAFNEWLETKNFFGVCVATVNSYLKHIKKGDILFIFCNDPSFVFDGSVRPPINPVSGKYFSGRDYFDEANDDFFAANKELRSLGDKFTDSISISLEKAYWSDVVHLYSLMKEHHNVGSKPWQIKSFIWDILVKAFEAYDAGQFEQPETA